MSKRILYLRSGPYEISGASYNLQEVGLLSEFCKRGIDCDLYYYSHESKKKIIDFPTAQLRIHWIKGIKILRSGIYPALLHKSFLNNFDVIICSEYSQIMTVLLSRLHSNVYCYNGPYYNLFKIKSTEKIYDRFFLKILNSNVKYFFCKSELATNYLNEKGISKTITVGVGQNIDEYKKDVIPDDNTLTLMKYMDTNECLLIVGSIDDRKNFPFTLNVFNQLIKIFPELRLVVVGKGDVGFIQKVLKKYPQQLQKSIYFFGMINNKQLKFIYPRAKAFLMPSKLEIFGMVLLEAMANGVIVISSNNGGAQTLIKNRVNGFIEPIDNTKSWVDLITKILEKNDLEVMKNKAKETIESQFSWSNIADRMIEKIEI